MFLIVAHLRIDNVKLWVKHFSPVFFYFTHSIIILHSIFLFFSLSFFLSFSLSLSLSLSIFLSLYICLFIFIYVVSHSGILRHILFTDSLISPQHLHCLLSVQVDILGFPFQRILKWWVGVRVASHQKFLAYRTLSLWLIPWRFAERTARVFLEGLLEDRSVMPV